MAANALEVRMAHLEGAYEQINTRLGDLRSDVQDLGRKTDANFRWMIGIILANWITIILTILLRQR